VNLERCTHEAKPRHYLQNWSWVCGGDLRLSSDFPTVFVRFLRVQIMPLGDFD